MAQGPVHCRRQAYELLLAQMPRIETTDGLLAAAAAVSLHEVEDLSLERTRQRLEGYAQRIKERVRSASDEARVAHLHEVMFEEEGFAGNVENYYDPNNSYISRVLESRRGLPIILSLIYKVVAERVGLSVKGINAPLHFMVGVQIEGVMMLVDPFFGGTALSRAEARERLEKWAGQPIAAQDVLTEATHRLWIARIIHNLANIFSRTGRESDMHAMLELRALVET